MFKRGDKVIIKGVVTSIRRNDKIGVTTSDGQWMTVPESCLETVKEPNE